MQKAVVGFFKQRVVDARAAGRYACSLRRLWSSSRQRHELERELASAHRKIGEAAEGSHVGDGSPSGQAVRDARAAHTQAQALLQQRQGGLAAAQEARTHEQAKQDALVGPIQAAHDKLRQDESAAAGAEDSQRQQLQGIQHDIRRAQSQLDSARAGKPTPQPAGAIEREIAGLQDRVAQAEKALVPAVEAHRQAAAAASQKHDELAAAKQARSLVLARCDEGVKALEGAVEEARSAGASAQGSLSLAHGKLGLAVLEANLAAPGVDAEIAAARSLMGRMSSIGQADSQTRTQMTADRGGAIRTAALLAGLGLIVCVVWSLTAKPSPPGDSGGHPGSVAHSTPAPSPPAPGKKAHTGTVAPTDLSPAMEKAILALPEWASGGCKVTGKPSANEAEWRSDGARVMRLTLPVEVRAGAGAKSLAGQARLRILVDAQDRILSYEVALPDPELAELEDLSRK